MDIFDILSLFLGLIGCLFGIFGFLISLLGCILTWFVYKKQCKQDEYLYSYRLEDML